MAFRRSRARSPRRSFRRSRLRPPNAPQRWQACNFFFDSADTITAAAFLNESVELLKIQEHIAGTGTAARSLEAASRRIELGGMVFNYGWNLIGAANDAPNVSDLWVHGIHLVIDRLDNTGAPSSLPDWIGNQAPVATLPSDAASDDEWPLRVLWRDRHITGQMAGLVSTAATNANLATNHPTRTVNIRLRRYLDDFTGLYFQFYDLFTSSAGANLSVHKWVWGTIYYRWVFGK